MKRMRNLWIGITAALLLLSGCIIETPVSPTTTSPAEAVLRVNLNTPSNGSEIASATPTLAWSSTIPAGSYHLQLAGDSDFQNIIIDGASLGDATYAVKAGALEYNHTYYWRVNAAKGGLISAWSDAWSFKTQGKATVSVDVNATLDGVPWNGNLNFSVSGPHSDYGSSVPASFDSLSTGTYALTYNSGGPAGASLASITPEPSQSVTAGGSVSFSLNFHKEAMGGINVTAVLDGNDWQGNISYSVNGPVQDFNSFVPGQFIGVPAGKYSLVYHNGGPPNAMLVNISPSPMQQLAPGGNLIYTLCFHTQQQYGTIDVRAVSGNKAVNGQVNFTLSGPVNMSGTAPARYTNMPPGVYTLQVVGGGPLGVMFQGVSPSQTQNLAAGGGIHFSIVYGGALVP